MSRTMTVDTGTELREFVESLVESGGYKTNSEVVRDGLRLLQEKRASSKLESLRKLIEDGEQSGSPIDWNVEEFLSRNKSR